ncbi:MAG: DUF2007 domain-containing protein [Pseudomonadota bacterium]
MIEVLRTTDPVRLSYALSLLEEADCEPFVADQYISAVEGSIGAFPRRILVPDDRAAAARLVLRSLPDE